MAQKTIPISGKDSLTAALIQTAHEPGDYHFFFNDTGVELPETYDWLNRIEETTGWHIERVGQSLIDIIKQNKILPSATARFCTRQSKIVPMEKWLGDGKHIVYFGIRADEDRIGYKPISKTCQVIPKYPLREHGINLGGVYAILQGKGLLPPSFYWAALEERVNELWSQQPSIFGGDWRTFLSFHEKRILFSGRSRTNCFFCWGQRRYEFVWLAETHPELFNQAKQLEENVGGSDYTWVKGITLEEIAKKREHYLDLRAKHIVKYIHNRALQQAADIEVETELSRTSCGLFCGK
jgi:hypothetical protein